MPLNPQIVRQQIENLKLAYPGLLEDDEAWVATLESETSFDDLLTNIVRRIEDARALSDGTSDRLKELAARRLRFEHRIETLRELAFKIMQAAELARVELPEATLSLRAGTQQLVGEADPASLPDHLCRISRALNRDMIKAALKDGVTVPGFQLSNSQSSLNIRIK